jgi:hypothetical protein
VCNAGYSGLLCDIDIDECSPDPCVHGECTETTDGVTLAVNSYHCECVSNWTGVDCGTLEKKLRLRSHWVDFAFVSYIAQGAVVLAFVCCGFSLGTNKPKKRYDIKFEDFTQDRKKY